MYLSGQIIATSHDLTPKDSWGKEIPLFQGNLGWWNIIPFGQNLWEVFSIRTPSRRSIPCAKKRSPLILLSNFCNLAYRVVELKSWLHDIYIYIDAFKKREAFKWKWKTRTKICYFRSSLESLESELLEIDCCRYIHTWGPYGAFLTKIIFCSSRVLGLDSWSIRPHPLGRCFFGVKLFF